MAKSNIRERRMATSPFPSLLENGKDDAAIFYCSWRMRRIPLPFFISFRKWRRNLCPFLSGKNFAAIFHLDWKRAKKHAATFDLKWKMAKLTLPLSISI